MRLIHTLQKWFGAVATKPTTFLVCKLCAFDDMLTRYATAPATEAQEPNKDKVSMTTLMIKNIPTTMSKQKLIELLEAEGLGCFDILHVPCDSRKAPCSLGYAFVNFCTSSAALRCIEVFEGKKWSCFSNSQKVCVAPNMVAVF